MKVIFKDISDDSTLGTISHTDFVETLIPAFRPEKHDIYVKHTFASKAGVKNWQITDLLIDNSKAVFNLSEAESATSLSTFANSQNRAADTYLKPYQIVEVDFGFYSDLFSTDGTLTQNNKKVSGLLPGEMHKRRPCIVLGVKDECVQVIPMSTKKRLNHDSQSILIDKSSFSKLAARYSDEPSHALLSMIQTVSTSRVFPPRNKEHKYEHKYYLYKVSQSDRNKLKEALAKQYNQDLAFQFNTLCSQHEKLKQEKIKILNTNQRIKNELSEKTERIKSIEDFILKFGQDLGAGNNLDEILSYYDIS